MIVSCILSNVWLTFKIFLALRLSISAVEAMSSAGLRMLVNPTTADSYAVINRDIHKGYSIVGADDSACFNAQSYQITN